MWKKKPCGRGKIDIVMGTLGNGNKPHVQVKESDKSITNVFVTSLQEAKKMFFKTPEQDLKSIYQPICEGISFAELCTFPCAEVPLVIMLATRHVFRPFLYFKKHDVLLTVERPVTYFDGNSVHLHGIVLLKLLFSLHEMKFKKSFFKNCPKTGWQEARRNRCPDVYKDVWLSLEPEGVDGEPDDPNLMDYHILPKYPKIH